MAGREQKPLTAEIAEKFRKAREENSAGQI
jgi:hypothetical protein